MKKGLALLAMLIAAVALVACGGDDGTTTETEATGGAAAESESGGESGAAAGGGEAGGEEAGGGAASTIDIEADPGGGLAYTEEEVSAKAGTLTIDFKNPQPLGHDVAVESEDGETLGGTDVISEASASATLKDLKPGKYTFYCTVPGHREAGMEGTLVVK